MTDARWTHVPGLDVPGLDVAGFERWLRTQQPELDRDPLTASVIAGGKSNLTYRIDGAARPLVLRRPPLGHVLSSAHDMRREHRVISALHPTSVPVPEALAFVDDTAAALVTGTPFFVMERVAGRALAHRSQNARYAPGALRAVSIELAETLARLHAVDPATVGLADLGRPDGYLARQLATWRRQYDASRSRDLPGLDALQDALAEGMPAAGRSAIVHGDYRLDNVLVDDGGDGRPRITAVLDWEMATLGDPLVDLGMLGMYWEITELMGDPAVMPSAIDPAAGYPSFDELVDAYAAAAGIVAPALPWYRAFAAYKLAVIAEGIHLRWQAGQTVGEGFAHIGDLVAPLAADGLRRLAAIRH